MAKAGGGDISRAPAAPRPPPCPPELKCFFGCLVVLLRQMEARHRAFASQQQLLLAEIEFLKRELRRRMDIAQDSIQQIRLRTSLKDEIAELLERTEPGTRGQAFDELEDTCLESFRSWIFSLANENTELKKKLTEVESQTELTENTADHQHRAKDSRADVRKLKKAYKTLVSEKDKEISAIRAEKSFAWNQFKSLEKDFRDACNSKSIEIKRANEEAEELKQTVHELRLEVQEKDGEIGRLQAEVEQLRSLVKNKDAETDPTETNQKWKKDLNVANRKSKLEGPASKEKSRILHATPVRREVKISRKSVSSAKGRHNQSGGQSETSQKRKRGSYTSSNAARRYSPRLQVKPAASPMLFTPAFTIPKLTAPTPPQL